jgi:hypothetical protein
MPDVALGIGGTPMRLAMRYVGPLTSIGMLFGGEGGGPPAGAPPPGAQTGGPPPGFMSSMPIEQVLVLMLLHAVVAVVCIGMLSTLPIQSGHAQKDGVTRRGLDHGAGASVREGVE